MSYRDIIVIGASAGGVETLSFLVGQLPADLPAAIFVVIHVPAHSRSMLPDILNRAGPLRAAHARNGEPIQHGKIYIAPPDAHLLVRDGFVEVAAGPKENGFRPAVDPLFRSAAQVYGARVIATVLSGALDDGTAGLAYVKQNGGIAIVQDPNDAMYSDMPRNAVENVDVDYILPAPEIPQALTRLVHNAVAGEGEGEVNEHPNEHVALIRHTKTEQESGTCSNAPSIFTCPDCGGVLWEINEGNVIRYRCHVGHLYTSTSMLSKQSEALEAALWTAVRALEESASLSRRLATRMRNHQQTTTAARYEKQADDAEQRAGLIREVIGNTHARPISGTVEEGNP